MDTWCYTVYDGIAAQTRGSSNTPNDCRMHIMAYTWLRGKVLRIRRVSVRGARATPPLQCSVWAAEMEMEVVRKISEIWFYLSVVISF